MRNPGQSKLQHSPTLNGLEVKQSVTKRMEQAAETKRKIIEAAVEILSDKGADSLTSGKLSARVRAASSCHPSRAL